MVVRKRLTRPEGPTVNSHVREGVGSSTSKAMSAEGAEQIIGSN